MDTCLTHYSMILFQFFLAFVLTHNIFILFWFMIMWLVGREFYLTQLLWMILRDVQKTFYLFDFFCFKNDKNWERNFFFTNRYDNNNKRSFSRLIFSSERKNALAKINIFTSFMFGNFFSRYFAHFPTNKDTFCEWNESECRSIFHLFFLLQFYSLLLPIDVYPSQFLNKKIRIRKRRSQEKGGKIVSLLLSKENRLDFFILFYFY